MGNPPVQQDDPYRIERPYAVAGASVPYVPAASANNYPVPAENRMARELLKCIDGHFDQDKVTQNLPGEEDNHCSDRRSQGTFLADSNVGEERSWARGNVETTDVCATSTRHAAYTEKILSSAHGTPVSVLQGDFSHSLIPETPSEGLSSSRVNLVFDTERCSKDSPVVSATLLSAANGRAGSDSESDGDSMALQLDGLGTSTTKTGELVHCQDSGEAASTDKVIFPTQHPRLCSVDHKSHEGETPREAPVSPGNVDVAGTTSNSVEERNTQQSCDVHEEMLEGTSDENAEKRKEPDHVSGPEGDSCLDLTTQAFSDGIAAAGNQSSQLDHNVSLVQQNNSLPDGNCDGQPAAIAECRSSATCVEETCMESRNAPSLPKPSEEDGKNSHLKNSPDTGARHMNLSVGLIDTDVVLTNFGSTIVCKDFNQTSSPERGAVSRSTKSKGAAKGGR